MISTHKVGANRNNARRSTGPRTATGKARAARNAQKHGLSVPIMADPLLATEVKLLAQEIAGESANDQLQQLATRIAEAQIELLRVRRTRRALLSCVRLSLDDETLMQEMFPKDWDMELPRRCGCAKPIRMPRGLKRSVEKSIMQDEFAPTLSDCAAGLAAMDRYEERALSRRKFAIREFDAARKALA